MGIQLGFTVMVVDRAVVNCAGGEGVDEGIGIADP